MSHASALGSLDRVAGRHHDSECRRLRRVGHLEQGWPARTLSRRCRAVAGEEAVESRLPAVRPEFIALAHRMADAAGEITRQVSQVRVQGGSSRATALV